MSFIMWSPKASGRERQEAGLRVACQLVVHVLFGSSVGVRVSIEVLYIIFEKEMRSEAGATWVWHVLRTARCTECQRRIAALRKGAISTNVRLGRH
jgi:hypothetical protein